MARDALIYSTYPSPHCMRVSLRPSGEGRLAVCSSHAAQAAGLLDVMPGAWNRSEHL